MEILELIAQGMSNREIAGKLFVSENTVKTHSSRVFDKLGARRRTQAVQLGKEFGPDVALEMSYERVIFRCKSQNHPKG